MKPGERIALITESARLLSARESEIDLILNHHGLPTSGYMYSNDGPYDYIIAKIGSDTNYDDELRELHSYLVGESDTTPSEAQPWVQGHLKLFMSHLAVRQEFIGSISQRMATDGVSGFVAHTSIEPSREWQSVIETGLRSCDAMVVFLHKGCRGMLETCGCEISGRGAWRAYLPDVPSGSSSKAGEPTPVGKVRPCSR